MRTRYTPLIYSTPVFSESDFSDDKRLPRKVEDDERGDLDEVVASSWLPRRRTCMASSERGLNVLLGVQYGLKASGGLLHVFFLVFLTTQSKLVLDYIYFV